MRIVNDVSSFIFPLPKSVSKCMEFGMDILLHSAKAMWLSRWLLGEQALDLDLYFTWSWQRECNGWCRDGTGDTLNMKVIAIVMLNIIRSAHTTCCSQCYLFCSVTFSVSDIKIFIQHFSRVKEMYFHVKKRKTDTKVYAWPYLV